MCHMAGNVVSESVPLSPTVRAQLYHAGKDAQPDADVQRQPVLPAALRQLHHAVIREAHLHGNVLHERRNLLQESLDHQRNAEDPDTLCHLRQCKHPRYRQGIAATRLWSLTSLSFA